MLRLPNMFVRFAAALALAMCLSGVGAAAEAPSTVNIAQVIDKEIVPAFMAFQGGAGQMHGTMVRLCTSPTGPNLATSRMVFRALVERWGRIEFIRLGPLSAENRTERILFWPDRRGRGLTQVQNIIRTSDETAIATKTLSKKSVAVQGLLALEYALFGTGSETTASLEGAFRCSYAKAISGNLVQLSEELSQGWSSDGDIRSLWLKPSKENPLFRDDKEQLGAFLKIIRDGLEITVTQRFDPFLRDSQKTAKPKSGLFWRSGNTVASLQANLAGLEGLVKAAGLESVASADNKRVIGGLMFEFKNASRALASSSDISTAQLLENKESYDSVAYARLVTNSMFTTMQDRLPTMFGLSSGFSSLDGD